MQGEGKDTQLGWHVFDDSMVLVWLKQVIKPCPYLTDLPWNKEWALIWLLLPAEVMGTVTNRCVRWLICLQRKYQLMGLIHTVVSAMKAKPQQTEDHVKKLNDSESLHKRGVTSRGARTSNAWGKEPTWRTWAGRKTAIWAPEKVKPGVCAVPSRTLRASATLYIQSCEHTDINAWVKKCGGVLWDLAGDILRLLYHYWKSVETGEDQRKANTVLIFRKGKKSWKLD